MHGHHTASYLLSLSMASALACVAMTALAESVRVGFTLYGCASADGAIVLDSLDEKVLPICPREQTRVAWSTDEPAFKRL